MRTLTFITSPGKATQQATPKARLAAKLAAPALAAIMVAVLGCGAGQVWAQSGAQGMSNPVAKPEAPPATATRSLPPVAPQNSAPSSANQLIERIQVDSRDVRIDEMRFGGETRSITVIPKGGLPAYDVQPATGERTWKVLGF